jgi:hypothetical protein
MSVRAVDAPARIRMSSERDVAVAPTAAAIVSGWRVDARDSVLQPQDGQTPVPALLLSRSPQHIGQVLPYGLMTLLAPQGRNRKSFIEQSARSVAYGW